MALRAIKLRSRQDRYSAPESAKVLTEAAGLAAVLLRRDGTLLYVSSGAGELLVPGVPAGIERTTALPVAVLTVLRRLAQSIGEDGRPTSQNIELADRRNFWVEARPWLETDMVLALFQPASNQVEWQDDLRHHIRNALHVMSSVMHLSGQIGRGGDKLAEMNSRIMAMAQAHDAVCLRDGRPQADAVQCITALHELVARAHGLNFGQLLLDFKGLVERPFWEMHQTAPLALIIHEVFSLAAACSEKGRIRQMWVRFDKDHAADCSILTLDGLCIGAECLNTRIVSALAKQLRADLSVPAAGILILRVPAATLPSVGGACI